MTVYEYSIGQLAKLANTKVQTVRYYEQKQLLQQPIRTQGGQRRYTRSALERLTFIRHGRELGFSLDNIKQLLSLEGQGERSCEEVDAIAKQHLELVNSRLERLKTLQIELERMISSCQKGKVEDCRVIEVLHNHKHCCNNHGEIEKI